MRERALYQRKGICNEEKSTISKERVLYQGKEFNIKGKGTISRERVLYPGKGLCCMRRGSVIRERVVWHCITYNVLVEKEYFRRGRHCCLARILENIKHHLLPPSTAPLFLTFPRVAVAQQV